MVTTERPPVASSVRHSWHEVLASPVVAIVAVWLSAALISVLAPDMVTGSEHDHIPIGAVTIWVWTLAATGYVLMAARQSSSLELTVGTAVIWLTVILVAVLAPVLVTGSDPTQIPIAVLVAPPVGTLATGYLALDEVVRRRR